jgi:orotidine-5'-phosphate decarboxylase
MVGIDPRPDLLPELLVQRHALHSNAAPRVWANALEEFCSRVLDVVSPLVPVVKFQIAFFEAAGAPGINTLHVLLRKARRLGLVTLLDAKRGDIGSTSQAYAESVFGKLPAGSSGSSGPIADAITVNPYLGRDSLEPFLKYVRDEGFGLFVLVRTSNPGSRDLQQAEIGSGGAKVYDLVARWVHEWSQGTRGQSGYGCVGGVVGGTAGDQVVCLRQTMPGTWLLIPGYGVQGATANDIAGGFDENGLGAIVNNSRGILFPPHAKPTDWEQAVESALLQMIDELARHTPAGRLRG